MTKRTNAALFLASMLTLSGKTIDEVIDSVYKDEDEFRKQHLCEPVHYTEDQLAAFRYMIAARNRRDFVELRELQHQYTLRHGNLPTHMQMQQAIEGSRQ